MFCKKCGHDVGNSKFCPVCGSPVGKEQQNKIVEPAKSSVMPAPAAPKKKKKINFVPVLIVICLLGLLAGGGFITYKYFTSPMKQFTTYLEQGDIDTAISYYNEIDNDAKQQEATQMLVNSAQKVYDNFLAEEIEYREAGRSITKISKTLKKNRDIQEISENLDALNESRTAYESAVKFQNSSQYADAIAEYEKVISEDSYYDTAQKAISDCKDLCREDALNQASSYKNNDKYSEAISVLEAALAILPNDSSLVSEKKLCEDMLSQKYGQEALQKAQEILNASQDYTSYKAARDILKDYLEQNPSDLTVKQKATEYDYSYYNGCINKANLIAADGRYNEAISMIRELYREYPDKSELNDLIIKYQNRNL